MADSARQASSSSQSSSSQAPAPSGTATPALTPTPGPSRLALSWDCELAPTARWAGGESKLFTSPAPDVTLSSSKVRQTALRFKRVLNPQHKDQTLVVALDHQPPRVAQPAMTVGALLTEWETIAAGTHRLLAVWLDGSGLPMLDGKGRPVLDVQWFHVDAPAPLPLAEWFVLAPSGTLNAGAASQANALTAYPHGLSLLHLAEPSAEPAQLSLLVRESDAIATGQLGAAHCRLEGFKSGDYHFRFSDASGAAIERVMTVNLDLGTP